MQGKFAAAPLSDIADCHGLVLLRNVAMRNVSLEPFISFSDSGEQTLMNNTIIKIILSCYGTVAVGRKRKPKKPKTLNSDILLFCNLD